MKYYLGENFSKSYYIDTMLQTGGTGYILFSIASSKNPDTAIEILKKFSNFEVMIDSGAFSVWSRGETMELDYLKNYYRKLKAYRNDLLFISLDVIPGKKYLKPTTKQIANACEESLKNYLELKKEFKVLPVFHQHDDFKYLDIYKKETDYFCISPANDSRVEERILWLDRVFSILKADYKTHSLAGTASKLLERYPFYSCDSVNWKMPSMWGQSKVEKDRRIASLLSRKSKINTLVKEIDYYKALQNNISVLWQKRGIKWQN